MERQLSQHLTIWSVLPQLVCDVASIRSALGSLSVFSLLNQYHCFNYLRFRISFVLMRIIPPYLYFLRLSWLFLDPFFSIWLLECLSNTNKQPNKNHIGINGTIFDLLETVAVLPCTIQYCGNIMIYFFINWGPLCFIISSLK